MPDSFMRLQKQTSIIFKNIFTGCIILFGVFFLTQCKKEAKAPIDLKKGYFPLKLNSVIIYDVDSTIYDDFSSQKTQYLFELKDIAVSEIPETAGRKTFLFERYKRKNNEEWIFQRAFTRTLIDLRGEEFLDNQRFVRLIFPPEKDKRWNGNTYNNIGYQEYFFTDANISQTINSIAFDSTVIIKQIDEFNAIREDYASETYANHIGLVKREIKGITKDFFTGEIKKGLIYKMQVKSYE